MPRAFSHSASLTPSLSIPSARSAGHPEIGPEKFPMLSRLSNYYSDAYYSNEELETLIAELERAAFVFGPDRVAINFLGPLHSLCCMAFIRRKSVALYAD